jgi:integrase
MPRKRTRRGNNEGTIFEEKSRKRWKAGVTLPDGTRRWVTGRTREAVAEKLSHLLGQVSAGAPLPPAGMTLSVVLAHWRDYTLPAKRRAPATVEQYHWALAIIDDALGKKRLATLTPEQVEHFLGARAAEGYSRNSVRILRTVFSQVLGEAERRGHVARNVAKLAHLPADATPAAQRRSLSPEEAARLIRAIDGDPLEAFFVLALTTGARRGELLGLSWDDVDLRAGTMTVRHALRKAGSGGYEVGPTKNPASVRTVRLGPSAVAALRRHRKAAVRHVGTEDLVFTTSTGAHLDPSRLRRRWESICEQAALEDVVLHELRHTAGSVAVDAGVNLSEVADQLGHANVNMLATTYRHRTRPVVEGVADVMDAFVTGPPKRTRK